MILPSTLDVNHLNIQVKKTGMHVKMMLIFDILLLDTYILFVMVLI